MVAATYLRPRLWEVLENGSPYTPFEWQAEHIHAKRHIPRLILPIGRRAGKTSAMKGEIVYEATKAPELVMGVYHSPLIYVVGPTRELYHKVWQPIYDLFVDSEDGSYKAPLGFMKQEHNKQRQWIRLKNGAQIFGKTADDPRSLQGDRVTLAVVDEAHDMNEDAWAKMMPSLGDSGGRLIAIGVPQGRGRFRSYWQLGQGEDPNFYSTNLPSSVNPIFHMRAKEAGYEDVDKYIRDALAADLTDDEFRQQYMAEWVEQDGQVFKDFEKCFTAPPGLAHASQSNVMGLDIGKINDFTVAYIGDLKTGRFLAGDRFVGVDYTVAVPRIARLYKAYNCQYIHADATGGGVPVVDMLRAEGCNVLPFNFTNESKARIVTTMAREIEKRQVAFLKKDGVLRKEMEVFEAEVRGTSVFYGHPRGYHDDAVLAAALLVDRMAQRHRFGQTRVSSYMSFGAKPKRRLVAA